MAKKPTKPTKTSAEPLGLVGRCFHIWGPDNKVNFQGIVRGQLTEQHFLVQYFEWFAGSPNTMEVVEIAEMKPGRNPGSWQFYEDAEQMNGWFEHHQHAHQEKAA